MKKLLACIAGMAMLGSMLAGCGGTASSASASAKASSAPAASASASASASAAKSGQTASSGAAVTLKIGTTAPPTTLVSQSAAMFGEKLAALSNGKMGVDLCTSGTLGTTAQHYAQLGQGDLDLFVTAFDTETVMKDSKDFSIFVVPYAFNDCAHLRKFLTTDKFNEMLQKVEKANGVKYVGLTGDMLPRCLSTTNTPVKTPADLKNLKIRTPESTAIVKVWSAWGASPIQTPGSEIYSSLESGLIDGQDNDVVGSTSTPLYEVQKYYMEINYIQQANVMWMSQKTWDKLTEEQRTWVQKAIAETDSQFSKDLFGAKYDDAKKLMQDSGVTFVDVDVDAFKASAADVVKKLDGSLFTAGLYDYVRGLAS